MKNMLEKFKKSKSSMALVILALVLVISGISFALFNPSINLLGRRNIKISNCELDINFKESDELMLVSKYPINDSDALKYKAKEVVITNNSTCDTAYYKLTIKDLNNSSINKNKIKFQLIDNTSGNTTNGSNPDTFLVEDSLNKKESKSYSIRLWIDESATNNDLFVNGNTSKPIEYKFALNLEAYDELVDDSIPNAPELTSNMIPVYYDESSKVWRKADSTNKDNSWYDYDNKMWANAVTVSATSSYSSGKYKYTKNIVSNTAVSLTCASNVSTEYKEVLNENYAYTIDNTKQYFYCAKKIPENCIYNGKYGCWDQLCFSTTGSGISTSKSYYFMDPSDTGAQYLPISIKSTNNNSTTFLTKKYSIVSNQVTTYEKKYVATSYSYNENDGVYTLVNPVLQTYSSDYINYYTCNSTSSKTCSVMYKIVGVSDKTITNADKYTSTKTEIIQSNNKLTLIDNSEKECANNQCTRNDYINAATGTVIPMSDINTMWVWIPRYKYTMLNTCANIKNPTKEKNPGCYGYAYKDEYHDDLVNELVNLGYVSNETEAEEIVTAWKNGKADDYFGLTFAEYADPDNSITELTFDKSFISTNVGEQSFSIKFENGIESTGTIKCIDAVTGASNTSETCTDTTNNGLVAGTSTYTHPAFWWDKNDNNIREANEELTGVWVGKFEVSSDTDCTPKNVDGVGSGCNLQTIRPQIKPNVTSWRGAQVGTLFNGIKKMRENGNKYGFATTDETHMMKNMEWGAVAYLSHSKYGINKEVAINSANTYTTGCGPQSEGSTTNGATCNSYTTTLGQSTSTTGNVYGVYDMNGGSWEYMMGNMVWSNGQQMSGNSTTNNYNSAFTGILNDSGKGTVFTGTYSFPSKKYYDKYSYGTVLYEYTRGKLGDATKEMAPVSSGTASWYSEYARFVTSSNPWVLRGGSCGIGASGGAFSFDNSNGNAYTNYSARAVISNLN